MWPICNSSSTHFSPAPAGYFPWAADLQDKLALLWAFHGSQFLHRTSTLSGVGSSTTAVWISAPETGALPSSPSLSLVLEGLLLLLFFFLTPHILGSILPFPISAFSYVCFASCATSVADVLSCVP